jgi:radical SAM protein with 4Fe4S-binding SPASM domain
VKRGREGYNREGCREAASFKINGVSPQQIKSHIQSICQDANIVLVPDLNLPYEAGESIFHSELLEYCGDCAKPRDARLQNVLKKYMALVTADARRDIFCDFGVRNFTVDARGKIWSCHTLCNNSEPLGTIGEDWGTITKRFEVSLGSKLRKSVFPDCRTCFLRGYCTSCPVAWQRINGEMAPNHSQCEMDRKAYLTVFRMSLETQEEQRI